MTKSKPEYYLDRSKPLPDGIFECPEEGCPKPRGERVIGFTGAGMKIHYARVHPDVSIPDDFLKKISASYSYAQPPTSQTVIPVGTMPRGKESDVLPIDDNDPGTPGDEVVMGGIDQNFMQDVKEVLGKPSNRNRPAYNSPVELSPNDGVRVKARNGVLYVDGQPADLQNFIDGLRLAVRIS